MVHLRVIAPPALAGRVYRMLREHPSALNIVRLEGAAEQPDGDFILCDVASEDASVIVADLRELGLEREGSIVLEPVSAIVSDAAGRAEEAAVGSPADAVVWETVEFQTSESAELSAGLCVALIQRQRGLARRSLRALAFGFPLGIGCALVLALAPRASTRRPTGWGTSPGPQPSSSRTRTSTRYS